MVRYPEVWLADYLQNMRSRCSSMREPEGKQVVTERESADGRVSRWSEQAITFVECLASSINRFSSLLSTYDIGHGQQGY